MIQTWAERDILDANDEMPEMNNSNHQKVFVI